MQMRKSVKQAMMDIKESAEQATNIAAGILLNRTNKTHEVFMDTFKDYSSLGTFQVDPLLSSPQSPVDEPVTTELDELLSIAL
ncbi:PX domain-containing protein [Fusarium keratoplasticum]|nr:PX domain-containing protein [Fusarium keratoplasticum]